MHTQLESVFSKHFIFALLKHFIFFFDFKNRKNLPIGHLCKMKGTLNRLAPIEKRFQFVKSVLEIVKLLFVLILRAKKISMHSRHSKLA